MKRVFLIVLDSFGIGEAPDAAAFGDTGSNTLRSVSSSGKFNIKNLKRLGLFNIDGVDYLDGEPLPAGAYGRLAELSNGKGLKLKEDERDKYPVGAAVYVVKPVDGSAGLNFRAEEWEYAGSHEVTGLP